MTIKHYPVIDMIATGRNISDLRKARGLSISDLQEYFGFEAPQAIYKWQKGQSLPSTDNLYALAFLLEVSIEDILIPREPQIQILSQEKSCDSCHFGLFYFGELVRVFHVFLKGFAEAIIIPPIRAVAITLRKIFNIRPTAIEESA